MSRVIGWLNEQDRDAIRILLGVTLALSLLLFADDAVDSLSKDPPPTEIREAPITTAVDGVKSPQDIAQDIIKEQQERR